MSQNLEQLITIWLNETSGWRHTGEFDNPPEFKTNEVYKRFLEICVQDGKLLYRARRELKRLKKNLQEMEREKRGER